jgi:cardiolipin synthase C
MTRFWRIAAWGAFSLAALIGSGLLLADRLTPPATGAPSTALTVIAHTDAKASALDREIGPLLVEYPGKTGALLLTDGVDAFAARALAAQQAGRSLDMMYYIWHDDLAGRLLAQEAWSAANRGVRVRLLLDDINLDGLDEKLATLDSHENIEVRLYNPFRNRKGIGRILEMAQRIFSLNHRMHNKAWIADNRAAVVGGRNIGSEYYGAGDEVNFRDLDLLLFGPAVTEVSAIFDRYWNSEAVVPLATLTSAKADRIEATLAWFEDEVASPEAQRYLRRVAVSPSVRDYAGKRLEPFWSDRIHLVSDPPSKQQDDDQSDWLVHRIVRDLSSAKHKALIISPYFVPGPEATAALVGMKTKDMTVGVVTNSLAANDVPAVYGAYRPYRDALVRGGVHVYELRAQGHPDSVLFGSGGASLHTKAYSVDDTHGFIGSFNLDPRSAYLNTEMGVIFDDPALARAVRDEYLRLAGPELSYWIDLNDSGEARWLDRAAQPSRLLDTAPDTRRGQRATATLMSWLPLESQL